MWKIPLFHLAFDRQEVDAVHQVLASGWLTQGETTAQFEQAFAECIGARHAIAVANGTAALHLANLVLEFGPNDEVICPALTFVASANAILYTGARPVFAEITSDADLNIAPAAIEAAITPHTKGIVVVHYAGYPCEMNAITAIARRYGLRVIEDCAHAPGVRYQGKMCGTIGDIGCFSFFSNKNITTGEGGMLTTNNDALAHKLRRLRSHGMTTVTLDRHRGHASSYDVTDLGYNYRIDEMRAALGLVQLQKLSAVNEQRAQLTAYYQHRLNPLDAVSLPFLHVPAYHAGYHIFPILLDDRIDRTRVMQHLKGSGIQTSIHYPPIHLFSYYATRFGYQPGMLPRTESVAQRELTLPLFPALTMTAIDEIVDALQISLSA